MRRFLSLFMMMLLFSGLVTSQNADKKWSVGLMGGFNEYNGDLGNGYFKFDDNSKLFLSLSLNAYLSPDFDLSLQGSTGDYGFKKNDLLYFDGRKKELDLLLKYKFANGYLLKENCRLAPFLAVGAGYAEYAGDRIVTEFHDMLLPLGFGLKFNITDALALQYQFLHHWTSYDKRDVKTVDLNDNFLEQSLGVIFSFGCGTKDSDGDGIKDRMDKCPNIFGIAAFEGCPDSDGDGIPDSQDKCPTVKGLAAFSGCPDTDGDGIQDSEDKCPTVKGTAAFNGCPDTDGDGIPDIDDKCPNVKGIAQFAGCPDTDGDGIQDSEDQCPQAKGPVALKGCPDKDNDGIPDKDDKCPDVAGVPANKGCPEVKEETKKIFEQALRGIQFETGKDIIRPTSYKILDQVVKVMTDNPNYNLEINGHTDNVGDPAKNMTLSQKRADAVKKYLVDKGVAAGRLTPKGHGDTQPIADNKTADGRAKNRRVEFKVTF